MECPSGEPMKYKFEYIWLDGGTPEPSLRSKTKVIDIDAVSPKISDLPIWFFDGSSTGQAEGSSSDCALKPVRMISDPGRSGAYLVMCEVLEADGKTPHPSNTRRLIDQDAAFDFWFGFEQEYVLTDPNTGLPLGFPKNGYPAPQGPYYCSVGFGKAVGRPLVEEHLDICLASGLEVTGINAEVMMGQWEFQLLGKNGAFAGDDLWLARYLLERTAEQYGAVVELHPKPVKGDWNGSGMHTNFSNNRMRTVSDEEYFRNIFRAFERYHDAHILEYGSSNEERLTGKHETADINTFKFGVSDRGASIRIPQTTKQDNWKGYLEDRRPASNADPYRVIARIVKTMSEVA